MNKRLNTNLYFLKKTRENIKYVFSMRDKAHFYDDYLEVSKSDELK